MPYARQAAAAALSFPARQPHSHNLPLGLLGDAGLVGLAAGLLLVVAFGWFAGPWRARTSLGRIAGCVLLGLGVSGLFEDLTFLPDYTLCSSSSPRSRSLTPGGGVVADLAPRAASARRRAGRPRGRPCGPVARRRRGRDLVPRRHGPRRVVRLAGQPRGPAPPSCSTRGSRPRRRRSPVADAAGDPALAMRAARRSVELNPGDGKSWTNLAGLCMAGDGTCATAAAEQAVARADPYDVELANAAIVMDRLGNTPRADELYRLSLLTNVQTGFTLPAQRVVHPGTNPMGMIDTVNAELNLLVAKRLAGDSIVPADYASRRCGRSPTRWWATATERRRRSPPRNAPPRTTRSHGTSPQCSPTSGARTSPMLIGAVLRGARLPLPRRPDLHRSARPELRHQLVSHLPATASSPAPRGYAGPSRIHGAGAAAGARLHASGRRRMSASVGRSCTSGPGVTGARSHALPAGPARWRASRRRADSPSMPRDASASPTSSPSFG